MTAPFPGQERARHMGELKRGEVRWNVFLELEHDATLGAVRGRIHFVGSDRHRSTAWVFLEPTEREVQDRFAEFSAVELWHFLAALEETPPSLTATSASPTSPTAPPGPPR